LFLRSREAGSCTAPYPKERHQPSGQQFLAIQTPWLDVRSFGCIRTNCTSPSGMYCASRSAYYARWPRSRRYYTCPVPRDRAANSAKTKTVAGRMRLQSSVSRGDLGPKLSSMLCLTEGLEITFAPGKGNLQPVSALLETPRSGGDYTSLTCRVESMARAIK